MQRVPELVGHTVLSIDTKGNFLGGLIGKA